MHLDRSIPTAIALVVMDIDDDGEYEVRSARTCARLGGALDPRIDDDGAYWFASGSDDGNGRTDSDSSTVLVDNTPPLVMCPARGRSTTASVLPESQGRQIRRGQGRR